MRSIQPLCHSMNQIRSMWTWLQPHDCNQFCQTLHIKSLSGMDTWHQWIAPSDWSDYVTATIVETSVYTSVYLDSRNYPVWWGAILHMQRKQMFLEASIHNIRHGHTGRYQNNKTMAVSDEYWRKLTLYVTHTANSSFYLTTKRLSNTFRIPQNIPRLPVKVLDHTRICRQQLIQQYSLENVT